MPTPILVPRPGAAGQLHEGWHVYLLRCSDGSLYAGITNRLDHRLAAHNRGVGAAYTRARLPVTLVYLQQALDRSAALQQEFALRRLSRAEKLQLVASWKGASRIGKRRPVQLARDLRKS